MKPVLVAVLAAAIPAIAAPADFTGTWRVTFAGPPKTMPKTIGSMIFDLKVDGDEIVGFADIGSWPGLAPIAEGKVDGDRISFTATGYLPSTTGTPTIQIEGTLSGDDLAIRMSTIRNAGGPGSGGVHEYRGGRLDAATTRTEKLKALATLSMHREFRTDLYAPVPPHSPTDFEATLIARAPGLAANIAAWERVKPNQSEAAAFSDRDLDDLIAFYNSPAGQNMIKVQPPAIETSLAAFLARLAP